MSSFNEFSNLIWTKFKLSTRNKKLISTVIVDRLSLIQTIKIMKYIYFLKLFTKLKHTKSKLKLARLYSTNNWTRRHKKLWKTCEMADTYILPLESIYQVQFTQKTRSTNTQSTIYHTSVSYFVGFCQDF